MARQANLRRTRAFSSGTSKALGVSMVSCAKARELARTISTAAEFSEFMSLSPPFFGLRFVTYAPASLLSDTDGQNISATQRAWKAGWGAHPLTYLIRIGVLLAS